MAVSAARTLYVCDNLRVLRGLDTDSIDLVATDPPFNAKRVFNAPLGSKAAGQLDDRWHWDEVTDEWFDLIADEHRGVKEVIEAAAVIEGGEITTKGDVRTGRVKNSTAAFLCWMAPRLIEMARILKPTGSLYLHCDDAANSYLRLMLDAVLGRRCFRNAIVWKRTARKFKGSQHAPKRFNSEADTLLFYAASDNAQFNAAAVADEYTESEIAERFKHADARGPYYLDTAHNRRSAAPRPNLCYEYRGFKPPYKSGWKVGMDRMQALDAEGDIIPDPSGQDRLMRKIRPGVGRHKGSIWSEIPDSSTLERTGWSTQKPVALYERIIRASSNPGDLILDPFCGCSTTLVAAERLGRQWIGCDIDPQAEPVVKTQMDKLLNPEQRSLFHVAGEMTTRKSPPRRTDIPRMADPKLRELVWRHQHQRCKNPYCDSRPRAVDLHLDHMIPKVRGGSDAPENRIGLCGNCNTRKGRKAWGAFLSAERAAQPHPESAPTR